MGEETYQLYHRNKVCQVDYVHLDADLQVFVTLNIAKVGFQMSIINLTDFTYIELSLSKIAKTEDMSVSCFRSSLSKLCIHLL